MKAWRVILIAFMMSQALSAITIAEIRIDGFPEDQQGEIIQASGLQIGQDYDAALIDDALNNLYSYFHEQHLYFIRIDLPELIPISDGEIMLLFRPRILQDNSGLKLRYQGVRHFSESKLHEMAFTSERASYSLNDLEAVFKRVLDVYHQRGYLFASVRLDSLVLDEELTAWLRIEEGGILMPQHFHFQGNNTTRESTLLKNSGLARQSVITPDIISQAEENIKSKSYIRDCTILPLDEENILIRIDEGRMTFLEGVIGLGEGEGSSRLSGMVKVDFQNLWGTDRGIRLFWRRTPSEYSELSLSYHESGHPALPLAADLFISRMLQDSLWIRSDWEIDLYYESLYQKIGISLGSRRISPGNSLSDIETDINTSLGAFWEFGNTRGNRIPISGKHLAASYDYIFDQREDHAKVELSARQYIPIKGRFIGYLGAHYKTNQQMQPPDYDLFGMGGYGSLRGYREDEFRSRKLGWINSEMRYMINPDTMLYVFYDQGFLYLPDDSLKLDLLALGFGIKLGTRLGILSLDYGLGYRDKGFSNIGLGMVHLGLDIAL